MTIGGSAGWGDEALTKPRQAGISGTEGWGEVETPLKVAPTTEAPSVVEPEGPSLWERFDQMMQGFDAKREEFLRRIESPETWKAVKEWVGKPARAEDLPGTPEFAKKGVPLAFGGLAVGGVTPKGMKDLGPLELPKGPKHPYQVLMEYQDKIFSGKWSVRDLRQLGEWGMVTSKAAQTGVDEVIHQLDQFKDPIEWAQHREREAETFTRPWFIKAASDFPKVVGYDLPKAILYDVPKQFTDPMLRFAHSLQEGRKYGQGAEVPEVELLKDLGMAAWVTLQGFAEWSVKPLPLVGPLAYGYKEWAEYWQKDPATAIAGVASVVAPAIKARMGTGEGPKLRPHEMETHENLIKSARIKDEIEAHARKYEEMFEGPDEPMIRTKQEMDASLEKARARRAGPLVETAEGWVPMPQARRGPVAPDEVTPFEMQQLIPEWAFAEGEVQPWNAPLSGNRTKPPKVEGYTQLRNGVLVKPDGTPFPTRANALVARKKLREAGLEYEVEQLGEKKYVLRSETPAEAREMALADELISKLERDIPEYRPRRKTEEEAFAEDILDMVEAEMGEYIGPEIGMEAHPFEQTLETTQQRTELYKSRMSSVGKDPDVFVNYQINNANRWRHGEDVDIGKVSDSLKEMALRSGELRAQLPIPQDRLALKEKATEAWAWVEQMRNEKNAKPEPSTTLGVGLTFDKLGEGFRKWFGKSVVRGDKGPKAVYHGTRAPLFRRFSSKYHGVNTGAPEAKGFFFTDDPNFADFFSTVPDISVGNEVHGGSWMLDTFKKAQDELMSNPEYMRKVDESNKLWSDAMILENPEDIAKARKLEEEVTGMEEAVARRYFKSRIVPAFLKLENPKIIDMKGENYGFSAYEVESKIGEYKAAGHDGVVIKNASNDYSREPSNIYIAFEPDQIRSAMSPEATGKEAIKLYSGPDVTAVKDMFDGVKRLKQTPLRSRLINAKERTVKALVDTQGNLKNSIEKWTKSVGDSALGNYINNRIILSRGGGARAAEYMKMYSKLIYGKLSERERNLLDQMIFSRRVIQIDKHEEARIAAGKKPRGIKHPSGLGRKEHEAFLENMRAELGNEGYTKLWARADGYFNAMREQLDILHKEGIISDKSYETLSRFDWVKRQSIDVIDPVIHLGKFKTRLDVRDSGIEALKAGEVTDVLETDSRMLLEDWVARTQGRVYRNRANQAMADLVKQYPDNPFIREKAPDEHWYPVKFYEGGKKKTYYMPRQWAKEWLLREADITYTAAQWMRVLSGSSILRPMATGINPGFAFTNFLRDAAHFWAVGNYMDKTGKWKSVYNPVSAPLDMARDVGRIFTDAWMRDGKYKDFIEDGGGMEFLAQQGTLIEHRMGHRRPLEGAQNVLGYVNMTSEILGRLAFREGAVRRIARREGLTAEQIHRDPKYRKFREEASAVARDYLDFGQGGSLTKAADAGIPYLNAATQATRGIFKTASRNPQGAIAKAGILGATAMSLYLAQRQQAPEAMKDISKDELRRNWVFFPFGNEPFIDADGQKRYVYLKFPKDQGQQFFATAAEFLTRRAMGDEIPEPGQIVKSLKELSPADMTSMPPTLSAMVAYFLNVDTWSGDPVWPGPDVKASEEYREGTPAYAIRVGQMTGLSPERLNAALEEVFTRGNAFTYPMGWASNKIMGQMPEDDRQQHIAMTLSQLPIAKRFLGVTNPYGEHREMVEGVAEDVNTRRFINERSFDILLRAHYDYGSLEKQDLKNFIKSRKDPGDVERLIDRWKFFKQVKGLEERKLWLRMHAMNPEARAQVFHNIWKDADEERKALIRKEIGQVPGIMTDEFRRYYSQLKKGG